MTGAERWIRDGAAVARRSDLARGVPPLWRGLVLLLALGACSSGSATQRDAGTGGVAGTGGAVGSGGAGGDASSGAGGEDAGMPATGP